MKITENTFGNHTWSMPFKPLHY